MSKQSKQNNLLISWEPPLLDWEMPEIDWEPIEINWDFITWEGIEIPDLKNELK